MQLTVHYLAAIEKAVVVAFVPEILPEGEHIWIAFKGFDWPIANDASEAYSDGLSIGNASGLRLLDGHTFGQALSNVECRDSVSS